MPTVHFNSLLQNHETCRHEGSVCSLEFAGMELGERAKKRRKKKKSPTESKQVFSPALAQRCGFLSFSAISIWMQTRGSMLVLQPNVNIHSSLLKNITWNWGHSTFLRLSEYNICWMVLAQSFQAEDEDGFSPQDKQEEQDEIPVDAAVRSALKAAAEVVITYY